jgi:hypothetical protein
VPEFGMTEGVLPANATVYATSGEHAKQQLENLNLESCNNSVKAAVATGGLRSSMPAM